MPEDPEKKRLRQGRYDKTEKGRARHRPVNQRRIYVGRTYVGRESQFPAPREAIVAFVQNLKEATLGTSE